MLGREVLKRHAELGEVLEKSTVLGYQEVFERFAELLVRDVGVGIGQTQLVVSVVLKVGSRKLDKLNAVKRRPRGLTPGVELTFIISSSRLISS
jgi:hypothetical protein